MSERTSVHTKQSSPAELGSRPIGRLLMQYSLPAIIASLATSLYNIVDSIFHRPRRRRYGNSPGLAITFPLMNLIVAFCVLIAVGGATVSSIFLGQKNIGKATDVVNNVILFCLVHAIVIGSITLIWLDLSFIFFRSNGCDHNPCTRIHAGDRFGNPRVLCIHRSE